MAIDKITGRMGLGAIVRDHKGYVIATKSLTKLGNLALITAEVLTALMQSFVEIWVSDKLCGE